jgi:carboxylesterase
VVHRQLFVWNLIFIREMPDRVDFQNPQFYPGPRVYKGREIGILLFHGYTATPVEVSLLAEFLNKKEGYTVYCPLLPGHGTKIDDLKDISWKDWVAHSESIYLSLRSNYNFRIVGGTSLGGLLAIYLGAKYPDINGLLVYSPALITQNRWAFLAHILKYFVNSIKKVRNRANKTLVDERWQGYTSDSLQAISQLLIFQRQVKRVLGNIQQPILIFQGSLDETVDSKGALEIYKGIKSSEKELVWMKESTHCLLIDKEWDEIAKKSLEFIRRVSRL